MIFCNRRCREINALAADTIVAGSRFEDQLSALVREGLIPEGVESESVFAQLRRADVDYAQGFALGRPVPIRALSEA